MIVILLYYNVIDGCGHRTYYGYYMVSFEYLERSFGQSVPFPIEMFDGAAPSDSAMAGQLPQRKCK